MGRLNKIRPQAKPLLQKAGNPRSQKVIKFVSFAVATILVIFIATILFRFYGSQSANQPATPLAAGSNSRAITSQTKAVPRQTQVPINSRQSPPVLPPEIHQPLPTSGEFININYENAEIYAAKIPANYVALTFDDGPTPEYTLPILAKLRQYGMKATFFVIGGRVAQHCNILQQIYREGHEIGNHTYDHLLLTKESSEAQWTQLAKNQQQIHQCLQQIGVNYYPRWFRAPYGDQNAQVLAHVKALGLNSALWSLDTHDWNIETTATMIANSVIQGGDRQLVLMHDGTEFNPAMQQNPQLNPSRQRTVEALDQILADYRAKGISSLTLSQAFR